MADETREAKIPPAQQPEHSRNGNSIPQDIQPEHVKPDEPAQKPPKGPSKLKQIWLKIGLDAPTLMMMLKGSVPPIIGIAIYQSNSVAAFYGTTGYLIPVTSVIGMAIFPRGMFIQNMFLNILAACVAAAVSLLALYCATQARLHTTPAGEPLTGYNSSASAVLGIWLFFNTYWVNAIKARMPQLQFPTIIFTIFSVVSVVYGTEFATMSVAMSFMRTLLVTFLTGFALATGVQFVVLPITSRTITFKKWNGYLMCMSGILKTQAAYLESMEHFDPESARAQQEEEVAKQEEKKKKHHPDAHIEPRPLLENAQGRKVKELLGKLYELHTKLPSDLNFAKREPAFGKICPKDMSEIWKRMKMIMVPVTGLTTTIDVLQRRADMGNWRNKNPSQQDLKTRNRQIDNLHELMHTLHEPFETMSTSIAGAFKHVLLVLEIEKAPKKQPDEESTGDQPGSLGFAAAYKRQLDEFYDSKKRSLREWCAHHDIKLPDDFFDSSFVRSDVLVMANEHPRERDQRQLFFALYVEYLLWRAGDAALDLVLHVDKRKAEGAFAKTRFIFPAMKTLSKWLKATFGREDIANEDYFVQEIDSGAAIELGASYSKRKDPEHLPPQNVWEKIGEIVRLIPRFFRSDESAYGFRVAAATMSITIVCFLEASQAWFLRNRCLWAAIMVPMCMTRTAGQSVFSFVLRIVGTVLAMVGCYIVYYIVDGKTPGVIVFLWLWIFCSYYIVAKKPKLILVGIMSVVTSIIIIGYELQVDKLGEAAASQSGQPYYQTYILAPYRLATVCAGVFVAFIWTIFPYPICETTELRKDLGGSLYLLANLYSVVHETIKSRLNPQSHGSEETKGTRAYHLRKATQQVFTKLIVLLTTLRQNSAFSKMQLHVGGQFPREEYESMIDGIQRLLQYTALIGYASKTFSQTSGDSEWSQDFRQLLGSVNATSHRLTSHLSLLSSSMGSARPLPPYLEVPQNGRYSKTMTQIDRDILGIQHIAEPEYSAFAVMTICSQCVNDDLMKITKRVKALVGEIDFSFHAVSTAAGESSDALSSMSSASWEEDEKKPEKAGSP